MKTAYEKTRAILVDGYSLPSLQAALSDYRRYIDGRIEAGKSLSKFKDSKAQDEYFESWGRAARAVDAMLHNANAIMWQIDEEAKTEPAYLDKQP